MRNKLTYLNKGWNNFHLLKHLNARLNEGCPLGIVSEAVNKSLRVRSCLILSFTSLRRAWLVVEYEQARERSYPHLVLHSVHSCLFECIIITTVIVKLLLVVQVNDIGDDL